MAARIIRVMGETDIVDIDPAAPAGATSPLLMGLTAADRLNLLGHWMDQDRGAALVAQPDNLAAISSIVADYMAAPERAAGFAGGANFMVLTVLREKWPVGTKARFQAMADRVQAAHTYIAVPCMAAKVDDLSDEAALKQAETSQLSLALPLFRRMRRQFANSSAVQALIRQGR